jgi:hypothetical protein
LKLQHGGKGMRDENVEDSIFQLPSTIEASLIPSHVAIIMDGNRRYVARRQMEKTSGHEFGYNILMHILRDFYELGVKSVSVYAFSVENFKRSEEEVATLMNLTQGKPILWPEFRFTHLFMAIVEYHGTCGENAICKTPKLKDSTPKCLCPSGFHKNITDPSSCQRTIQFPQSSCSSNYQSINYQFIPLDYVNFTGERNKTNRKVLRLQDCMLACLNNCECLGFSHKLSGKGYCVHHFGRLLNGYWSPKLRMPTYLKLSAKQKNVSGNQYVGMLSVVEKVCDAALSLLFLPNDAEHTTCNLIMICSIFGIELLCGVWPI